MRFIPIFLVAVLVLGCEKGSFTTKPQLKFKSMNSNRISGNQVLVIKLELTDKEGDFTTLLGYKKTVAGCPTSDRLDSTFFKIPEDFINTKGSRGEVDITLDQFSRGSVSCFLPGGGVRPDTSVYGFWTRDKAGNLSDTVYTEPVIIFN
jgi:hypothetical protein